jgi:hypothetical protein
MQQRHTYHRFPQHRSPVIGLLGLANAIIACIFPMILLYLVFLPCGDGGCHTRISSETVTAISTNPTPLPDTGEVQIVGVDTKPANNHKQLLAKDVTQAANSYVEIRADDYQLLNNKKKDLDKHIDK